MNYLYYFAIYVNSPFDVKRKHISHTKQLITPLPLPLMTWTAA